MATLEPGDAAAFPWPSFPSYATAAECSGADALRVPLARAHRRPRCAARAGARAAHEARVPGQSQQPHRVRASGAGEVRAFLDALPEDVLCVLDEAYAEYADPEPEGPALVREGRPRLCVLRTFSKVYGLAALRIGYAVAAPEVADALNRVRTIFNVNQPAQEAALAALGETAAVAERVAHARRARERLYDVLAAAGLDPEPSQANFVFADVPGGDGVSLARRLLEEEGILVRELPGFGAPGSIRVTVGTDAENDAFAEALGRVVLSPSGGPAVPLG